MKRHYWLASGLVLAGVSVVGLAQQIPPPGVPVGPVSATVPIPRMVRTSNESVDDLLNLLTLVRTEKASIEQREKELVEKIKKRVAEQNEKLKAAGLIEEGFKTDVPLVEDVRRP